MRVLNRKIPLTLLFGDLAIFIFSLWVALFIRGNTLERSAGFAEHLVPFSFLFVIWLLVFFIAGLYERRNIILRKSLLSITANAQIINAVIAVSFFYLIPLFGISPKTTLFVYLIISSALVIWWRLSGYYLFSATQKSEDAILIAGGKEADELEKEVNANKGYNLKFVSRVDVSIPNTSVKKDIVDKIILDGVGVIVVDLQDPRVATILPSLYELIFSRVRFVSMDKVYEDIFNRVPVSLVRESWFLENISTTPKIMFDALKRVMDASLALFLGIISLALYPIVALFIKLEDKGPIFFKQERIGKNGSIIRLSKFRSMKIEGKTDEERIMKIGRFLRKTRIDELPQLWSVVKGDLSLIGPRPETPKLVKLYESEIPYYNIRHLIKPGLSGWAQLYQKDPPKLDDRDGEVGKYQTKNKLSYDLYYLKNRSLVLDLAITLKTIKELVMRRGV